MSYSILAHWKLKQQLGPELTPRLIRIGCWYDEELGIWFAPTARKAQAARLMIKGYRSHATATKRFRRSSRCTSLETGEARTARRCQKHYRDTVDKEK